MEITTIITWNTGLYLLYYGAQFFLDYRRYQGSNHGASVFSYKESLETTPVKISASTYDVRPEDQADVISTSPSGAEADALEQPMVEVEGMIEDQGLPMDEFIRYAGDHSSNINF
jgi:hypothetical protein